MQPLNTQWSPRVGDRVHVKGTPLDATVCRVTGWGEARRYLLDLTVSTGTHAAYSIGEIGPSGAGE
jgi:hypothetical protein